VSAWGGALASPQTAPRPGSVCLLHAGGSTAHSGRQACRLTEALYCAARWAVGWMISLMVELAGKTCGGRQAGGAPKRSQTGKPCSRDKSGQKPFETV
jgi:hypothetical protein